MKTYLEYKDEKSQKFWEISVSNNEIITRYGKIDTDGKEIIKAFESDAVAMYEMHKQILAKRKKGYAMPNSISMAELLKFPATNLSDLDTDQYRNLQGTYSKVIVIDSDITLDELDLDTRFDANHSTGGFIIKGNLYINGGIKNDCGDTGLFLIVEGNVIADFVVGGGSEISLKGKNLIPSFIVGHYNGGLLTVLNANAICFINSDHWCNVEGKIKLEVDVFEGDVETLIEIWSKKMEFFECEMDDDEEYYYLDMDNFNTHIFDDKKRLKLLSKLAQSI